MANDSQKPGGGLPPIGGIGPYKVRFEADTTALTVGVNTALDNIRGELDALKTGFAEFETTLAHSLTSTITRLRTDLSGIIAELNRATQSLRTEMSAASNVSSTSMAGGGSGGSGGSGGNGGGGSFYIPPISPANFTSPTYSASSGSAVGGSPTSSFYIPPVTGGSSGGGTGPSSVGYTPLEGSYPQQLQQFRFDQITPAEGIFVHEMGTMSQIQNLNRQTRHDYEGAVGSLQQHLNQLGVQGKTSYLETSINQEISTLQRVSQQFKSEFQQKYGPGTKTGQTLAEMLQNPEAMNAAFGQSTRPSVIKEEILARSPDLANNPELLMQEIASIQESRSRSSAKTNQNFIQAQYLLESAAASDQLAQEAMQKLKSAPAASSSSSTQMKSSFARGVGEFMAGELISNMASGLGGPYAQFGNASFYANAWKQAVPYDLQAGGLGLNVGVNAQSAILGLQHSGHLQHLASPEIAQTAGLESSFAGVQGAAFLFKDAASTYKFAMYLGLNPGTAAQVAGQAVGGGSTQSPTNLFTSIKQIADQTGMSNSAIAQGMSGMQNALTASYQTTTAAPEYTSLMMSLYKGAGMTPAERQQSLSSFESMFGHGSNLNLMSSQLFVNAYAQTHGGQIGNPATLISEANAGHITPAELKVLVPQLHQIAMSQGQAAFQMNAQGILTKNAFGMSGLDLYKEFANPNFNPNAILQQAENAQNPTHPGGGKKPTTIHPPNGNYWNVLSETAKVDNAAISIGNATLSFSHTIGPVAGGATSLLGHLGEIAGIATVGGLGATLLGGGIKSLWNKLFGGGGGSPPAGGGGIPPEDGGGGTPLGGGGLGGCSPCEQQAAQAATATATNTAKIAETLGGLGLAGAGAYVLSQSGKWLPNMLSPTGQMAAVGSTFESALTALEKELGSLHLGSPSSSPSSLPGTSGNLGYMRWSSVTGGKLNPFAQKMAPYAAYVSQHTGLPEPLLLAQWAFESNWGKSTAATQDHNLGGIEPWGNYKPGPDPKYVGFPSLSAFAKGAAAFYDQNSNYANLLTQARSGAPIGTLIGILGNTGYARNSAYAQDLSQMLASGGFGSYTPGHIQSGTQNTLLAPSSLPIINYYQSVLSKAIKTPQSSHPDTPNLANQAGVTALKLLLGSSLSSSLPGVGLGLSLLGGGGLESLIALSALGL